MGCSLAWASYIREQRTNDMKTLVSIFLLVIGTFSFAIAHQESGKPFGTTSNGISQLLPSADQQKSQVTTLNNPRFKEAQAEEATAQPSSPLPTWAYVLVGGLVILLLSFLFHFRLKKALMSVTSMLLSMFLVVEALSVLILS